VFVVPNNVVQQLDTDLSEHFDGESAKEDDAELQYQHYELDSECEVTISESLGNEITVDCQQFIVLSVTYPVGELLSAVAEERFEGEIPDETTDVKCHHSNADGEVGVAVEAHRNTDMDVAEAAAQFANQYEE